LSDVVEFVMYFRFLIYAWNKMSTLYIIQQHVVLSKQ